MKESFEILRQKIITKEDLLFFIGEINFVKKFIFKETKRPLSEKVKGKISEDFRNYLQELEKSWLSSRSSQQQSVFFEELKKNLQEIPQIKMEIAFLPSKSFLLKLKEWLGKRISQEIILDILINPGLVAGAIIEYQGKRFNSSTAKEIDKLVPEKRLYER